MRELSFETPEKDLQGFQTEVVWIKRHLGEDYLDRILHKVEKQNLEVIIAVENQVWCMMA